MDGGGASACALLCMRVRSALDVGRGGALCFWDAGGPPPSPDMGGLSACRRARLWGRARFPPPPPFCTAAASMYVCTTPAVDLANVPSPPPSCTVAPCGTLSVEHSDLASVCPSERGWGRWGRRCLVGVREEDAGRFGNDAHWVWSAAAVAAAAAVMAARFYGRSEMGPVAAASLLFTHGWRWGSGGGGDLAAGACRGGRGVVRWGEGVGLRGQRRQVLRVGTWRLRRLPAPAVHAVVGAMGHERQQTRTDSLGPLLAQLTTHPSHGSTSSFPWERESRASL